MMGAILGTLIFIWLGIFLWKAAKIVLRDIDNIFKS